MSRCILCNAKTDDAVCIDCRDAFMHYRELFRAEILLRQGASAQDVMDLRFERYYNFMEFDDCTEEEKDEMLNTSTEELVAQVNEALSGERDKFPMSDEEMADFVRYIKRRIMKESEKRNGRNEQMHKDRTNV